MIQVESLDQPLIARIHAEKFFAPYDHVTRCQLSLTQFTVKTKHMPHFSLSADEGMSCTSALTALALVLPSDRMANVVFWFFGHLLQKLGFYFDRKTTFSAKQKAVVQQIGVWSQGSMAQTTWETFLMEKELFTEDMFFLANGLHAAETVKIEGQQPRVRVIQNSPTRLGGFRVGRCFRKKILQSWHRISFVLFFRAFLLALFTAAFEFSVWPTTVGLQFFQIDFRHHILPFLIFATGRAGEMWKKAGPQAIFKWTSFGISQVWISKTFLAVRIVHFAFVARDGRISGFLLHFVWRQWKRRNGIFGWSVRVRRNGRRRRSRVIFIWFSWLVVFPCFLRFIWLGARNLVPGHHFGDFFIWVRNRRIGVAHFFGP